MFADDLYEDIAKSRIIAVVVVDDVDNAVPTAQSLVRGGVIHIELALRTDVSLAALEAIARNVPEMTVGAGTILTPEQLRQARSAGARFAVSPGFTPAVVNEAKTLGMSFAPGIATPSEIEAAWNMGCTVQKLFPAQPLGGASYLKSVNAAYRHLNLSFIPLGGVSPNNVGDWLALPEVVAVGGSWLANRDLIRSKQWDKIESNARVAKEQIAAQAAGAVAHAPSSHK